MSPQEVADFLGIPVGTLHQWRHRGTGPKGAKVGRHVRYRRSDVEAWFDERLLASAKDGESVSARQDVQRNRTTREQQDTPALSVTSTRN